VRGSDPKDNEGNEEERMPPIAGPTAPLHEPIARRWSPRAFADRAVDPAILARLFDAGRWAASCYNEQPWSWLVARREEPVAFGQLLSTLVPTNQEWARHAPVLAISLARTRFVRNGKPNRHAGHDVGQAAAQIAIEATSLGLAIHQMAGFEPERVRELCAVPDGWEPMAAIAIGYAGDPDALPDALRERELAQRQRRPLAELVFGTTFGETAGFVREGYR
jgi:nitroreductase